MRVELADTEERKQYGLMDRRSLDPQSGMLFTYDSLQDSTAGFWMFRTHVPLDIAFMDSAGQVVAILSMDPCQVQDARVCRHSQYSPHLPFQSALEVNRGFFAEHAIGVGSTITLVP
ncbi:MAG: DUF192 domain-containing protein [Pseudomonas sp.]